MISLAILVLAPLATQDTSITLEKIQENLFREARKLKDFEDEWDVRVLDNRRVPVSRLTQRRYLDDSKCWIKIEVNGQPDLIQGSDGEETFAINPEKKSFTLQKGAHPDFTASFDGDNESRMHPGLNFVFDGPWDFRFTTNPRVEVRQIVREKMDGKNTRKYVLEGEDRRAGTRAKLTVWIDDSRWLLLKFEGEAFFPGGATYVEGKQTFSRQPAALRDELFEFTTQEPEGFTRVSWNDFWSSKRG